MNSVEQDLRKLAKALQEQEKGRVKLKLIGYSMAFRRKAKKNRKYDLLAQAAKNLLGVL